MQYSRTQQDGAAGEAAADIRGLSPRAEGSQGLWEPSAAGGGAIGACQAAPGETAAVQSAASQGHASSVDLQVLQAQTAQQQQQQQLLLQAAQHQQDQSLLGQELPTASMSDLAALLAASGLQPQLCFPDSPHACSAAPQGQEGLLGHKILLPSTTTAAAGQVSPGGQACLWAPALESASDAAAAGLGTSHHSSQNSAADAAGSSQAAAAVAAAAAAATAALYHGSTISRSSSSSSTAMTCTSAGASIEPGACGSLLSELNVTLDTLTALLTGGRDDQCEQPVWMVINLQVRTLCRRSQARGWAPLSPCVVHQSCPAWAPLCQATAWQAVVWNNLKQCFRLFQGCHHGMHQQHKHLTELTPCSLTYGPWGHPAVREMGHNS